ncbi:MAG: hypothetical protein OEY22_09950 [Candidatus Bathyarchaeota archaeon]|nr:hypothetical protein [Candidatus Bathyarchaeota archaeon]MDH5787120.1 hypothetical protein [Candidatus Bathyarchaeota archaeon]
MLDNFKIRVRVLFLRWARRNSAWHRIVEYIEDAAVIMGLGWLRVSLPAIKWVCLLFGGVYFVCGVSPTLPQPLPWIINWSIILCVFYFGARVEYIRTGQAERDMMSRIKKQE